MVILIAKSLVVIRAIKMALEHCTETLQIEEHVTEAIFKNFQTTDLIIVDWECVVKAGLEAQCEKIQNQIVMLISRHHLGLKSELDKKGFKKILEKPFDTQSLMEMCGLSAVAKAPSALKDADPGTFTAASLAQRFVSTPTLRPSLVKNLHEKELLPENVNEQLERAIFSYCHEHFATIAKEVIRSEIKQLTEEKAKKLF